jgi:hypothetical protein
MVRSRFYPVVLHLIRQLDTISARQAINDATHLIKLTLDALDDVFVNGFGDFGQHDVLEVGPIDAVQKKMQLVMPKSLTIFVRMRRLAVAVKAVIGVCSE